ncbi:FAD/NAD(P)-binding protein [Rhizobium leguminosarum]
MRIDHHPHHSIIIVGGGFAGTLTALNLLDRTTVPLAITIVERREELGRGVAYSTTEPAHLVNGPADNFSLYADDPGHLSRWLSEKAAANDRQPPENIGSSSPPRYLYGTYVRDELKRAVGEARFGSSLHHIRASASTLSSTPHRIQVSTTDGLVVEADEAVLALGVFAPDPPTHGNAVAGDPRFAVNPWDAPALDRLKDCEEILLIGASLSMVDAVASMEARGFHGRYRVISRRGQFVEGRREVAAARDFLADEPLPSTARSLLSLVKTERRAIAASGGDWQGLPLAIRPHILSLWQKADDLERLRFARHLRAFWDVTAHRSAPESNLIVETVLSQGRLSHGVARLIDLAVDKQGVIARLKTRTGIERHVFDGVIDCRGHQLHDWRRISDPFIRQLLASGEVRPHSTGFGIDATPEGDLIDEEGRIHRNLSAIGHPLRGVAWESSSITEQRAQAIALADRILLKFTPARAAS